MTGERPGDLNEGGRVHPHLVAGARRLLSNRGGLLAFDVGVGKTYTGIAVLARARQEGWVRRPVILVPNSIVWKWEADIRRVLPDYRIAVIGSKKKVVTRGPRKGLVTSTTDTPQDRARKWTRFQAGEFDVVLLTYTALGRTRMNESAIREYAEKTEAIQREVKLRQRNAEKAKKLTERQEAILKEGVAAWVAEMMELPESWQYDPGIAWDDIGVDLLIVDEAQNFKFGRWGGDAVVIGVFGRLDAVIRRHLCRIRAQRAQGRLVARWLFRASARRRMDSVRQGQIGRRPGSWFSPSGSDGPVRRVWYMDHRRGHAYSAHSTRRIHHQRTRRLSGGATRCLVVAPGLRRQRPT